MNTKEKEDFLEILDNHTYNGKLLSLGQWTERVEQMKEMVQTEKSTYEKEYLNTLESMDAETLAGYVVKYVNKAIELSERGASVVAEIDLMQKVLLKTLKKEKK